MGDYWPLASCQANALQKTKDIALFSWKMTIHGICAFFFPREEKYTHEVNGSPVFKEQGEGVSPLKS